MKLISKGAEAFIYIKDNKIIKKRIKKSYRIKELDERLRRIRTRREAKIISKLYSLNLNVPKLYCVDEKNYVLEMELIKGKPLKEILNKSNFKFFAKEIARFLTIIHNNNIIHHDLTTSNMIFHNSKLFFIDFGLSFHSTKIEDKAVDLHLLERALESKHSNFWKAMFNEILKNYNPKDKEKIIKRLEIIRKRGRYKMKD